jgi:hypothetical protein
LLAVFPASLLGAPGIGSIRLCGNDPQAAGGLHRYGYVVLNAWEHGRIAALKALNPGIKVLVYKDMASTRSYAASGGVDDALLPTGVGYAFAEREHPEWFLADTTGARMEWPYSGHWWMDVGSPSYQRAWLEQVEDELEVRGWDGVVIDNAMADPSHYTAGRTIAKYPTASAYQAATRSFLAGIGPALKSAGFLVIPNISDPTPSLWSSWISLTSGGTFEHWTKWSGAASGTGYIDGKSWLMHAELFTATQGQGKIFIANTGSSSNTDVRTMRYSRASFLLWWNGGASALVYNVCNQDPWASEWTADIGAPAGSAYQVGTSWRREFSGGTVVVNPLKTSSATVSLGRPYLTPDGTTVTSVTLAPTSGLVLRSVPPPQATTVPPQSPQPPQGVAPPSGPAPVIALTGHVTTQRKVLLTWSGHAANELSIYRNGVLIATVSGRSFADNPRGRGTFRYKVVETRTPARFSNEIGVRL